MTLALFYTTSFRRDCKRLKKRGADMEKLQRIVQQILEGASLDAKCRDHPLKGEFVGARNCHIDPDWVLVYAIVGEELRLIRTGSHADLFKE
jgi:mRNA interferase YafQ